MKNNKSTKLHEAITSIMKSVLKEEGPDAMRIDWAIMKDQVENEIRDYTMDLAQEIVYKSRARVMDSLASIITKHNMTDTTHGRMNGRMLDRAMEELDEDGIQDIAMEAASDIEVALTKFADQLGQFAVHTVSSRER